MTFRPIIGIACDLENNSSYYKLPITYRLAVEKAGGLPVLLPATDHPEVRSGYLNLIQALLLPGGDDLDPQLYHQEPHPRTRESDRLRQKFDLAMLAACEKIAMPVLAVCMGCQTLNVLRGGDLIQYIPEYPRLHSLPHSSDPAISGDRNAWHQVEMEPAAKLTSICGQSRMEVNSRHRQGIGRLGKNLRLAAWTADGIIEAIEDVSLPFCIGVQWHPENLSGPAGDRLFNALVQAAADYAESRQAENMESPG